MRLFLRIPQHRRSPWEAPALYGPVWRKSLAEGGSTMTKFMICLQFPHRKLELRPVDARACSQGHWKRRAAARTGPTLGSEAVQLGRAVHARMWQRWS